jgi:hypothetical protein
MPLAADLQPFSCRSHCQLIQHWPRKISSGDPAVSAGSRKGSITGARRHIQYTLTGSNIHRFAEGFTNNLQNYADTMIVT